MFDKPLAMYGTLRVTVLYLSLRPYSFGLRISTSKTIGVTPAVHKANSVWVLRANVSDVENGVFKPDVSSSVEPFSGLPDFTNGLGKDMQKNYDPELARGYMRDDYPYSPNVFQTQWRPRWASGKVIWENPFQNAVKTILQPRITQWLASTPQLSKSSQPFRMLDVAYGDGKIIEFFAKRLIDFPGIDGTRRVQYGCDLSPGIAKLGAEKLFKENISVELCLCDGTNLPYADGVFDIVSHVGSINAWPSIKTGIDEFWRVAKPGGFIFFIDEDFSTLNPADAAWRKANWVDKKQTVWTAPVELVPKEAREFYHTNIYLDRSGFEVIGSPKIPLGESGYYLISFVKP